MANNCLVTKLNAVVNDNKLDKLGYYRVKVNIDESVAEAKRRVRIFNYDVSSDNHFIVNVIGGSSKISLNNDFSNPVSSIDQTSQSSSGTNIYLLIGEYELEVFSKYKVKDFSLENKCPSIMEFDLNSFAYTNPRIINVYGQNDVTGDLSDFENKNLLEALVIYGNSPGYSKVTGNIMSLCNDVKLTTLTLSRCNKIEGDIEALANAMYNNGNGRTDGTLIVNAGRSTVTCGSDKCEDYGGYTATITFSVSGPTISVSKN